MTYWLDSVKIYPCESCCKLGETVIKNKIMPELKKCSDEILALLDCEKVGRLMQKREIGVFVDGHYCVTSGYEKPDISIDIGRPENCFFRLLIVPEEEKIEQVSSITTQFYRAIKRMDLMNHIWKQLWKIRFIISNQLKKLMRILILTMIYR